MQLTIRTLHEASDRFLLRVTIFNDNEDVINLRSAQWLLLPKGQSTPIEPSVGGIGIAESVVCSNLPENRPLINPQVILPDQSTELEAVLHLWDQNIKLEVSRGVYLQFPEQSRDFHGWLIFNLNSSANSLPIYLSIDT